MADFKPNSGLDNMAVDACAWMNAARGRKSKRAHEVEMVVRYFDEGRVLINARLDQQGYGVAAAVMLFEPPATGGRLGALIAVGFAE